MRTVRPYRIIWAAAATIVMIVPAAAQHLQNGIGGRVNNSGVIRFKSDTGQFRNAAPASSLTNNVIEFNGTNNAFTDIAKDPTTATAFGADASMRIPGLVRYTRDSVAQNVQSRYYTDLEMAGGSPKNIVDGVYVGQRYVITRSGPRSYSGTFTYDGALLQNITAESGLSGNTDRYDNLTILNGPKEVRKFDEVRMSRTFLSDANATMLVKGSMFWGTNSTISAPVTVDSAGMLVTGGGRTMLNADLTINDGEFVAIDNADTTTIAAGSTLTVGSNANAKLALGQNTQLHVLGGYVNSFAPRTNVRFDPTSLVNFDATTPQVIQSTVASNAYGHLRTGRSAKTVNGDVFLVSTLSVNDEDLNVGTSMLSMTTGMAQYTNFTEVIGAMQRDLRGGAPGELYVFNNERTHMRFTVLPQYLTLDVHPVTSPLAYDATTDVQRKINVRYTGDWTALVRAGYKRTDIPATWLPDVSESLLRFFDAQGPAISDVRKMLPVPGTSYLRNGTVDLRSFGFVEHGLLSSTGVPESRIDNGHDLLMRGNRDILKAIASGRWSNPATWDEGREPDPKDRVSISGFTVHVGYVRANDNYAILEAYPDTMAMAVTLADVPNTSLLIGYTNTFNTFSLKRTAGVLFTQNRVAPSLVPFTTLDVSAANLDAGLLIYPGASYTVPDLLIGADATVFNGGVLQVGSN